jgi:lipoprotein NlpD
MRRYRVARLILLAAPLVMGGCIPEGGQHRPDWDDAPPLQPVAQQGDSRDPRIPYRDVSAGQRAHGIAGPAAPLPNWQTRPVTPDARFVAATTYIVQPGDTLRGIADRTGSASEAIARSNNLQRPFTVRVGQRLAVPGGRYHLVRAGQSGIAIARAYGVPWARIVAANDLTEPYILRTGQRILIPGSELNSTASERAAAFSLDIDDIITGGEPAPAPDTRPARVPPPPRRTLPSTTPIEAPARLSGSFAWPVRGPIVKRFGPGASGERNDGIQIAVPVGTPVLAAADGTVAYVGSEIAVLGGLVIIKHGGGWTTVYGHASKLLVHRGETVKRGQTIALSGNTGLAGRAELHFEIRKGRDPVDPVSQLPPR